MYASNYLEDKILGAFNGTPYTAPSTVYATLSSTDPTDSGAEIIEPSYEQYQRQVIILTSPAAMSGGTGFQNQAEIKWAAPHSDQASASFIAIYDSLNGGNMLMYAPLNSIKAIKANSEPVLRANEGKFWLTGNLSVAFKTTILNTMRGVSLAAISPYITLINGNPESGGTELAGGNFSRKLITFGTPVEQANGQRIISNTAAIDFDVATSNLGNYDTDAIYNSAFSGVLLLYKTGVADTYLQGDKTSYAIGAVQFALN